MRITQLVSSNYPTFPTSKHAINAHVAWLTNGLVKRGHDVHLFASSDSETNAALHATTPSLVSMQLPDTLVRHHLMSHVSNCFEYAQKNADIVHSHFNLISSFVGRVSSVPTVTSIHSPISEEIRPLMEQYKSERYVSFSLAQRKQCPALHWYANIYHGVDTSLFTFNPEPEGYLLYLGRVTEDKGVHLAIEAAKAAGLPLRIAGVSYPGEGYWQRAIEPHINGKTIRFMGHASFEDKIPLLQNAKALLFPTQVQEVFGYVMVEAMSCGTPVIGWNNGSVAEIVKDGVTGFVVDDLPGMIGAIHKLDTVDRAKVRQRAEMFFSVEKMVQGYEKVYRRILDEETYKTARDIQRADGKANGANGASASNGVQA